MIRVSEFEITEYRGLSEGPILAYVKSAIGGKNDIESHQTFEIKICSKLTKNIELFFAILLPTSSNALFI